ncbi:MAG: hypothetical protein PHD10_05000 [Bacilli bacterium]|nr:hypothetical protein [Bacilli bacterium]MDD4608465.1 hypothetical protein [Bacilli bacterium]
MKTPLRFQITEFDCGTIALLNAVSYLFDREEIPAELVRAINLYTLDCYDEKGNLGAGGTSRHAIDLLTHWITDFAESKNFNIECERLEGELVTLDVLKRCLDQNGVVFIRCWQLCEHYVIITKIDDNDAYIFDSYYLDENYYDKDNEVKIIFDQPFLYNRVVKLNRLLSESKKDFSLGDIAKRECVLIVRSSN